MTTTGRMLSLLLASMGIGGGVVEAHNTMAFSRADGATASLPAHEGPSISIPANRIVFGPTGVKAHGLELKAHAAKTRKRRPESASSADTMIVDTSSRMYALDERVPSSPSAAPKQRLGSSADVDEELECRPVLPDRAPARRATSACRLDP